MGVGGEAGGLLPALALNSASHVNIFMCVCGGPGWACGTAWRRNGARVRPWRTAPRLFLRWTARCVVAPPPPPIPPPIPPSPPHPPPTPAPIHSPCRFSCCRLCVRSLSVLVFGALHHCVLELVCGMCMCWRVCVQMVAPGHSVAFFGVYDGHNGDTASDLLSTELHPRIFADGAFFRDPASALSAAFLDIDAKVRNHPACPPRPPPTRRRHGMFGARMWVHCGWALHLPLRLPGTQHRQP